jgi:hypothetical protein
MANEFFRAYGPDVAVTISPRGQGIMEVFLDGEKIFDRKAEGIYPDLARVRKMKEKFPPRLPAWKGFPLPPTIKRHSPSCLQEGLSFYPASSLWAIGDETPI